MGQDSNLNGSDFTIVTVVPQYDVFARDMVPHAAKVVS